MGVLALSDCHTKNPNTPIISKSINNPIKNNSNSNFKRTKNTVIKTLSKKSNNVYSKYFARQSKISCEKANQQQNLPIFITNTNEQTTNHQLYIEKRPNQNYSSEKEKKSSNSEKE